MTTITLPRAVVEQALHVAESAAYPVALIKALRAALAQQAEPVQDQDVENAIEAAYWQFDCRKKGLNEWASAPQSDRDAFKAEARKLVRGYFPTRQAQDTKREMLAVADAFIRGKRAALAQQAEPVQEPITRLFGTLPVHDAQQALAQQAEPVQEPVAWRCACGANLYIDEYGHPASRAVPVSYGQTLEEAMRETREKAQAYEAGWKAGLAHQAEPVEPVAWSGYDLDGMVEAFSRVIDAHHSSKHPFHNPIDMDAQMALRILRGFIPAMKAYAVPPQRKPLPKHDQHCVDVPGYGLTAVRLVRAVERAHGIT